MLAGISRSAFSESSTLRHIDALRGLHEVHLRRHHDASGMGMRSATRSPTTRPDAVVDLMGGRIALGVPKEAQAFSVEKRPRPPAQRAGVLLK